jgi:hypothetical protein
MTETHRITDEVYDRHMLYDHSHEQLPEPLRTYARELDAREPESKGAPERAYYDADGRMTKGYDYREQGQVPPRVKIESDSTMMLGRLLIAAFAMIIGAIAWAGYAAWPVIRFMMGW